MKHEPRFQRSFYNESVNTPDVIIAGAGIIGVSIALELRGRGAQVLVLDRGEPGKESSSAAAGMLAPAAPETPRALHPLAFLSAKLFPAYVERLEDLAQMKVDFRRWGTIALPEASSVPGEYRRLEEKELQGMEPALLTRGRHAYFVQEDSVDPALLMQAALLAAEKNGIEVRGHHGVQEIGIQGAGLEVLTDSGRLSTRAVVDCRGAWSGPPVKPRKGQSAYIQPQRGGVLEHVVNAPEVYLVPRSTGKILVGATVEDVGFDKRVDTNAIDTLTRAAAALVPELASAPVTESWAGLRPGTPDDLPIIGPAEARGSFIATGHFRNGILLAPATAQIIADLIAAKTSGLDISAFSPARFAAAHVNSSRNSG